jgi:formate dehydrogenase subunit gamma
MVAPGGYLPWSDEQAQAIVAAHAGRPGPLLETLHALQSSFGYLDDRAVPLVATGLNLSRAEVHGVITFYSDFRRTPPPVLEVRICRGEACQAVGAEALVAAAQERLGVKLGEPGDSLEVQQVFCLGNCALGPSGVVGGQLHGRLSADRLVQLVDEHQGGRA